MNEEPPGAAAAASQASAAVAASVLPLGCAYGCAVSLLWLLGGLLVGFALSELWQLHPHL